ncbi:hypothetical protein ACQPZX_19760 [Actinoplanes sp. CA-142083]|uniref:hypothetical protein n=1 Tax=Actinoplanes sp. CA-142083 TaxID=3239903 RepID=UPI003D9337BB
MPLDRLSDSEQAVVDAFRVGEMADLSQADDPIVRASVLRFLLLGGGPPPERGDLPALRLTGARVTGRLELACADVTAPISLHACDFDEKIEIYEATLRQVSFRRCGLHGIDASDAVFVAGLRLLDCRSEGTLQLAGAHIANALLLDGTRLSDPVMALDGMRLNVGGDVVAQNGFRCRGEVRLTNAEVGGSLRWEGATLENPGGTALRAQDLRVGAIANFCTGFSADGALTLSYAQVTSHLCFERATIRGPLDLRYAHTRYLLLQPTAAPAGLVDLSHMRAGVLRDDPDTWPAELRLDGLRYEALTDADDHERRLAWLRRDDRGYRPQTYGQLAAFFRAAGRDDDAREVLLAGERHRRETLTRLGRLWGHLQDATVGYGYRPGRAVAWLLALLLVGAVVFQADPPRAAEPAKAPAFTAVAYAADLILPVIDLGQQSQYVPRGWTVWVAYLLILAGLVFATTITAAAARRLRRT